MHAIGEFSRITGLSIKALRLYHERGILVPSVVDESSGYRYYDHANVERARIVAHLRSLDFGLDEIAEMLAGAEEDADVVEFFERKRDEILARMTREKEIARHLEEIIKKEKEAVMALDTTEFSVEEKDVETMLIAGMRYKGKYSDCGKKFGPIARAMGPNVCGKPFNLYYDSEFKEDDADIETCFPVKKGKSGRGVTVRELPGGRCVSLIHKGPYDAIGRSYEKIMAYVQKKGYRPAVPIREIYIKGPGMIFRGKPENYLTEIQIMIEG